MITEVIKSMDVGIDVSGTVTHAVSNSGKITIGSPTKGGEFYYTFDPGAPFEEGKRRADMAIRILNYTKWRLDNPEGQV